MNSSPHRLRLYRKVRRAVIFTVVCVAAMAPAQIAKRQPKNKGPRALAVLELAANGKAHLVPVTIMISGRFYDASVYKADPVPMALEPGTVYEALKTGVSQGLFTVGAALKSESSGWIGAGQWRTNAQIEAEKERAKAQREKLAQKAPPAETEIGGPPKLRRGPGSGASTPPQPSTTQAPAESAPRQDTSRKSESTNATKENEPGASQKSSVPPAVEDPNRPILRRQAPSETAHQQTKAEPRTEPLKGAAQLIPAISDADGPEPRPYTYQMNPEEEQSFLKKMLDMAADEVQTRASQLGQSRAVKGKSPAPQFQDVQLRVFDLASNNQPALVLTANARMPENDLTYLVAVVARQDIYADLHKVFAETTDNQHLDVLPKYELIDAADADGDGVGELLFRETSDVGSSFGVYRVVGDRLWPLFEGRPGA